MTDIPTNFLRGQKTYRTTVEKPKNKNIGRKQTSTNQMKRITFEDKDQPDILEINYEIPSKPSRTLNARHARRHMTHIPETDRPDVLFGIDEYKEARNTRRFHSIRKFSATSSVPDVPDILEPIIDTSSKQMSRPVSITNVKKIKYEESKNSENNLESKEKPIVPSVLNKNSSLGEIKEQKNETERNSEKSLKDNEKLKNKNEKNNKISEEIKDKIYDEINEEELKKKEKENKEKILEELKEKKEEEEEKKKDRRRRKIRGRKKSRRGKEI